MIEISAVSKSYNRAKAKALDAVSLSIPDGCIFGFLGPNGAGKTTTLKLITGSLEADSGTVLVDGHSVITEPLKSKRAIGFVPDNPELFSRLKGIEYLNFIADVYELSREARISAIERYATMFEIAGVLNAKIGSYSRGMKQKLIIAGSLLPDPKNWLLDEPMVGLDPHAAFKLKELMRERANAGKCVFFSTHVMEVAEKVCDQLAIINKGKIMFTGSLEDLRELKGKDTSLESLFLELVEDKEQV